MFTGKCYDCGTTIPYLLPYPMLCDCCAEQYLVVLHAHPENVLTPWAREQGWRYAPKCGFAYCLDLFEPLPVIEPDSEIVREINLNPDFECPETTVAESLLEALVKRFK